MTAFVHVDFPTQHPGVERAERVVEALSRAFHGRWALRTLALIGSPVVRLGAVLAGLATARRLAREDVQYWNAALGDARLMADISRAMSDIALSDARA